MTDPNVQTTESGEEVILEPGDPGYVDPNQPTSASGDPIDTDPETVPGKDEPLGAIAPAGEDLRHVQREGEDLATHLARVRNVAVKSENPTDIVPNMPQVTMGERVEVEGEEGLVHTRPAEIEQEIDSDALAEESPEEVEEEEVAEEEETTT